MKARVLCLVSVIAVATMAAAGCAPGDSGGPSGAAGAARFLHEHQFDVHGNRIVVMDNDGAPGDVSRVLEYELDFTAMTATQVWSYTANPTVYTFVLGEPIRLADGGTFVNWSTAGQMERLDASGSQIWKLNTDAGFAFGFQTIATSLYLGGNTP